MNVIRQKRGNAKACLTRAVEFLSYICKDTTIEMLEIRLSRVVEAWNEFSSMHYECLKEIEDDEVSDYEKDFGVYESKYFEAHSGLNKAIRERKNTENANSDDSVLKQIANQQETLLKTFDTSKTTSSKCNLPPIVIPPFSGNYKDWPSFRDLFMGSVDNKPELTPTQKFHYLKSFLSDDAANLIKHIPISDASYIEAWERLENRYDRVNLIVQSYVQTFLSLPVMTGSNPQTLRAITDNADEVIRGLNALEKTSRDPWLVFLLLTKLDEETKHAWAEEVGCRDDITITELIKFLERRCDALESCQTLNKSSVVRNKTMKPIRAHVAKSSENVLRCVLCKGDHNLSQCSQFLGFDILSRRNFTKNQSVCFNCLRPGHSSNKCKSSFRCRVCRSRHHTLVHLEDVKVGHSQLPSNPNVQPAKSSSSPSELPSSSNVSPLMNNHSLELCFQRQTILPTILAQVQDNRGHLITSRVLMDTGSQSTFMAESFAQRIGYPKKHARIPVIGLSSKNAGCTKGYVSITLCSRFNSHKLSVDAFILNKLTSNLPSKSFNVSDWEYIQPLDLADPSFNVSSPIDIILGADKIWSIIRPEQIKGSHGRPIAQNTTFGWVISGETFDPNLIGNEISSFHSAMDIDDSLKRFWELEEVGNYKITNVLNDPAEVHFQQTFSRSPDGRYVVRLPFKTPNPIFADTLQSAVSRLHSMERKFRKNPELHVMYSKFMQEYLALGHMELIPSNQRYVNMSQQFYLPHHAVLKPDSSTTKLRVVFDGSVKDSNGVSLNNNLLIGPPIQRDLFGVCLRFRQHRFVFTADIVKMFRQIWVHKDDTEYQRIVWRESCSDQIQHYRLRTVTYGTASAPFLSVRVLQQIAKDYESTYPNAARVLLNDVYVDDVMTGANSVESLLSLQSDLVALLSKANLQLRKWSSNCWALLSTKNPDECEYSFVDPERAEMLIKVLGMFWNPATDMFSYRVNLTNPCPSLTRRTLLSEIARIFDPLGLLAPSVILFKIMFQMLWSTELKLSWDSPLPAEIAERWLSYRQQLPSFENIRVPRNVFRSDEVIELHGFSDASTLAYAAVVFARSKGPSGDVSVKIVAAKTKVAPLKPISIPRLELCGALLLSRLLQLVTSNFNVTVSETFAWCDSEIVLHWLSSPPRRWTTFVANRTAAILESIPRYSWHHIRSDSNPADCASRGVHPSDLVNHTLWWTGPTWLSLPKEQWPTTKFSLAESEFVGLEERPVSKHTLVASFDEHVVQTLISKISSWYRLQRIVAFCLRFVSNCRVGIHNRATDGLTLEDIKQARIAILKYVQMNSFKDDIQHLKSKNHLHAKSTLWRYSAFLDSDGLLRIDGRIKHACVSINMKHPIILPKCSPVSFLIISDVHQRYLHTGVSETFALTRQQYWIMGSRNLIRKIIHNCKQCFMQRKVTSQQIMGDLPLHRVQPIRPFTNTGCDYAGPFIIKLSRCRKPKTSKAYIALFVCMCTKAMHLELVSDLTTDAFLAALRRFISRRGKCSNMYSDNGTNFQGARRTLTEMHKLVLSHAHNDTVRAALAKDDIAWHFIPPSAPHFGGLWEAGVKSVKTHLRRVVWNSILTYEEFCTVLTQVEAVLNSRPLCSMSDCDLNPLTPAHFLIGEPLTAVPEPSYTTLPSNRLSYWQHIQSMVQGFWKRWHSEYLTTLQERPKWQKSTKNISPGDLVVIKEPNLPPTKWILGRIESVNPGADNHVRVATVRTASGTFTRPISKLAVLPVS